MGCAVQGGCPGLSDYVIAWYGFIFLLGEVHSRHLERDLHCNRCLLWLIFSNCLHLQAMEGESTGRQVCLVGLVGISPYVFSFGCCLQYMLCGSFTWRCGNADADGCQTLVYL